MAIENVKPMHKWTPTPVHEKSKNEISQRNTGRQQAEKSEIEKELAGTK